MAHDDPWQLADDEDLLDTPGYSPDKFYTRATNKHDHSTEVRVPLPKDIGNTIDRYVNDNEWPQYTSRAAFIRDAVYHRLKYLAANHPMSAMQQRSIGLLDVEMELGRIGILAEQAEHTLDVMEETWVKTQGAARESREAVIEAGVRAIPFMPKEFKDQAVEMVERWVRDLDRQK